ncbi:ribosomal protein S10 domain-containing protein [Mycena sp. CBHHK59/15]|nr:ribosomal protein S10 domain-containing protein [Mycena sp. CBHHK59/15]
MEMEAFLSAPAPRIPESARDLDADLDELESLGGKEPSHASILEPPKIASTSKELFGTHERTALQMLPGNLDPRKLPLPGPLGETFTEVEYAATIVHGRSIHRPFRHPRTHNLTVAQIQFNSHTITEMTLFVHFATHAAYSLGIPCSRMYTLPTKRTLWTVLRGPFAHKKAQENFERKVHRRGLKAYDADPEVVDRWFKYLRRHAMGGVGMRFTKWERMPMGVGKKTASEVMGAVNRSKQLATSSSRIKSLGDKIVKREMGELDATADSIVLQTVEAK